MEMLVKDPYSSFDPHEYITEYYSVLGPENQFLLKFYHDVFNSLPEGLTMLEVGGGPTVYQLFSASRRSTEIVFTDYLPSNLKEVANWMAKDPKALNWEEFSKIVAGFEAENGDELKLKAMEIEARTRAAIKKMAPCNVLSSESLKLDDNDRFDIVSSGFCLECISGDESAFKSAISNVIKRIAPSGYLILTLLKNSNHYRVGGGTFPAFPVDSEYMKNLLASKKFKISELREIAAEHEQGYEGLIALMAKSII